jgi:1,4-dihydroxy-6-naphthoate synthase
MDKNTAHQIETLIRKSLEFGFANYPFIQDYVKEHSQEMSEDVMRQHIELYVNNFSLNLGEEGKNAIKVLFEVFLTSHSSGYLYQSKSDLLFL